MALKIAVIGAGAVGLATAVQLQEAIPNCQVTVIADGFGRDTTSDGAAGMFRPSIEKNPGTPENLLKKWLHASWDYFDKIAHSEEGGEAGVQIVAGYQFFNSPKKSSLEKDFIYEYRECTEAEKRMFPGQPYKYGWRCTTLMVECRKFLPYLMKRQENVVIGGTRQKDDEDITPRKHDRDSIFENACKLMPSLKGSKLVWDWVGLRPYREPVRVEKDVLYFKLGSLPVVYNYGHGGEGVSLSWGTAVDAVKLAKEHLMPTSKL